MIPRLTYFPFLQSRTLTVRPCCNLPVFCSWDVMTFHKKSYKIKIVFGPSSDQQTPQEKNCLRQISNWDHRKTEECPTKPSEFCLPFFIVCPLHACCRRKSIRTPVWLYCTTTEVLSCTAVVYQVLQCCYLSLIHI